LITALLFVAVVLKTGASWEALIRMAFACFMLALIFIDYRHQLLPNAITYPAFVFALAASAALGGWGEQIVGTFDFSIIVPALESEFAPRRAAIIGGFLLAAAAPGFWLLDRLDLILFNKYFEWEEMNEEEEEIIEAPRRDRAIYGTMILGLFLAVLWAIAVVKLSPNNLPAYEGAYEGLLRASISALIGGGLIWMLRAFHMYVRGFVGMGLGDVKMLSIIGAFLGWRGMLGVLLLGSILGVIFGVIIKYRQKGGGRTAVPFGVCLGIASLVVMLK
jgi:prepilin signal peptidase PulO-like enzyme (type II secretory pathway)